MSNRGMGWLEKLDDLVDRAFVHEQDDDSDVDDDSIAAGAHQGAPSDGSDDSENIGPRAFSRNVSRNIGGCPLPGDIGQLRSKLHLPSLSPRRREDRDSPVEAEGDFDSFVAEAPSSGSPVVPPLLQHDSMLLRSEGKENSVASELSIPLDRLPVPPLFSENSSPDIKIGKSTRTMPPVPPARERTEPPNVEVEAGSQSTEASTTASAPFQKTGEVTQEGEVGTHLVSTVASSQITPPPSTSNIQESDSERDVPVSTSDSDGQSSEDLDRLLFVEGDIDIAESDTGDWSERSIEISVAHSMDEDESEDFQVEFPLLPWEKGSDEPFDKSMNCHGVVHLRLLRAQRLPCSIGSNIYAVVALPPWKGKIRTERTNAYRGPQNSGVCVRWDHLDEVDCSSMVHAWNSEDTPIPTITVDLMFSPLQMMDFKIGSLHLSCEPLMRSPGMWTTMWLPVELPQKLSERADHTSVDDMTPLILVEASFVPSIFEEDTEEVGVGGSIQEGGNMHINDVVNIVPDSPRMAASVTKLSVSSRSSQVTPLISKKFHHFRVQSFWSPATCSVCSSMVTGWKRGYRCEVCNIDCCSNCQLQVDVQIPCGSRAAQAAVENAIQNKFEVNKLMSMVAPLDPSREVSKTIDELPTFSNDGLKTRHTPALKKETFDSASTKEGIGWLKLNVVRACLFDRPLPPDSEPDKIFDVDTSRFLRQGDHYVRISWTGSKESTRTRTIQNTGRPHFDSDEMKFLVPHYGMEYRIELLDANTDKPVGTTLLTTQGLLQTQRDLMIEEEGLTAGVRQWKRGVEKRRTLLELRSGLKSGFGSDFFSSSSRAKDPSTKSDGKARPGEVSGWVEVDVCLEENMDILYGSKPFKCPPVPSDHLNVDMFQIHIARIGALVNDVKNGVKSYMYLVSWKDPALTSLSLILFVAICVRFNSEYVGSLPVFFLVIYMLRLASIRRRGDLKRRFNQKEKDACIEAEKKISVMYSLHRPVGRVEVDVHRGKNIRSRDLGLAGSVGCRIYWDPLRNLDEVMKDASIAYDKSVGSSHDIAFTSYQYSKHPVWDEINESDESRRLNQLLPDQGSFFEPERALSQDTSRKKATCVHFPVLQPIVALRKKDVADGNQVPKGSVRLDSWSASPGAIVVQVSFRDVLNKLPGFDDVLGEVSIPLANLVEKGEIRGWFHVLEVGSTEVVPVDNKDEDHLDASGASTLAGSDKTGESESPFKTIDESPQVYLHMRWDPPESSIEVSETDREASIVVAEEMIRSAIVSQDNKLDLIGSSIGAFNTVRGLGGNVQFIQNTLGTILDVIEKARNLFNFSDPFKSSVLLLVLTVLWLFLALVPTKLLVLAGGLAQYAVTFVARYGGRSSAPVDAESNLKSNSDDEKSEGAPIVTWLLNAFRSLPTDEDLRRTYFWESRRFGERESEILARNKRESRLRQLWKAEWYACVDIKVAKSKGGSAISSEDRLWDWETVFAIVQGRRFLWWDSVYDFDNGESPLGRIFLAGHAGLAGLSPLDLRELHKDEISLVVNIFGRGMEGQQKLTMMCGNSQMKDELENAVLAASTKAD